MGNINPIINRETFLPHNFDHLQYDYFLTLSVIQHDYILKLFLGRSQNHYSSESFQHFYSDVISYSQSSLMLCIQQNP